MAISRAAAIPAYGARKPRPDRAVPPRVAGTVRPRVALRDIVVPFASAVAVALVLSLYIAGYALVTSANSDRGRLKEQLRAVRAENGVIQTDLNNRLGTEAVAEWARSNQMVDDGAAPVVIVGSH